MRAYDSDAVTYDGDVYCTECLPDDVDVDDDDVSPIFADSEWDDYPACGECGTVHDYVGLTSNGQTVDAWRSDSASGEYIAIDDDGSAYYMGDLIAEPGEDGGPDWKAIKTWMDDGGYYPNIWSTNDHGNVTLHDSAGNAIGGIV